MPPSIKITREQILNGAFELVRQKGEKALNARSLAKELKCSTQPIFNHFSGMEEVSQGVEKEAKKLHDHYMETGYRNHKLPFMGLGLAYIEFAQKEKVLFNLLFLSGKYSVHSLGEMLVGEDDQAVIKGLCQALGLDLKAAEELMIQCWLQVHGIATFIATNPVNIPQEQIEHLLDHAFEAHLNQLKRG